MAQRNALQKLMARLAGPETPPQTWRWIGPDHTEKLEEWDEVFRGWDIPRYLNALEQARAVYNPDWNDLLDLYDLVMLDAHIRAECTSRDLQVLMQPFTVQRANGEVHEEATAFLDQEWFRTLVRHILAAERYGYSAIQLRLNEALTDVEVQLIPRRHIHIRNQHLLVNPYDWDGIPLAELDNVLLVRNEAEPYGLLSSAAQVWVRKKDALRGLWEYGERAVFPLMALFHGGIYNEDEILKKSGFMAKLRRSAWGIFGRDDKLETVGGNMPYGYQAFLDSIKAYNDELSRCLSGQSAMNATQNTPAKVQDKMLGRFTSHDKMLIQTAINSRVLPWLQPLFGEPLRLKWLRYDQLDQLEMAQLLATLKKDLQLVPDKGQMEKLFGMRLNEAPAPAPSLSAAPTANPAPDGAEGEE